MVIVKTWEENKKETIDYLKFNGYGKIRKIWKNIFICTKLGNQLKDVTVLN